MSLSQFDPAAAVHGGGTLVTVHGPVRRAAGESDDIEFVVLVTQNGAVARGRTWARGAQDSWGAQLEVRGGTFVPGRATATALALIEVQVPPGILTQFWTEEIELVEAQAESAQS